ncbi:MlaD family protein [bacterium]|nr:MlaD family protein [bacterium]
MKKNSFSTEIKVGFFILTALFALVLFVVIQAKGGKYRGYDLTASFDYVSGLEVGSPVRVSGVRVGEVKSIDIVYDVAPKVLVKMKIRQDVKIARYSRITIQTLGIIGEKYIEIAPSQKQEYISAGETVEGDNPLSLERIADVGQSIVVRFNDILGDVRNITGEKDVQVNIGRLVKGAASATERIDNFFEQMEGMAQELSETNKSIQDMVVTQTPKLEELVDNANLLLVSGKDKMELTMEDIRALAVEGKKSGKMFDEISGAAKEFKSVAEGMQVFIEDTSKEVKKTSLPIQEFFTKLQNEGLISELMKEKELLGQIKTEMTLLQESTSQFKETAEKISLFSDELNKLLLNINEGKGSVGQFVSNEELYKEVLDFVKDIKANPWKLFIRRRN